VSEALVLIRNLAHVYLPGTPMETVALRDANLTVQRGEIAALVGENGAGKSTLLHYVNALLRPRQRGAVLVFGTDTADPRCDLASIRRRVGLVLQQPHQQLFERYVGDDVAYGPRRLGLSREAVRERVHWAMEVVGLEFERFVDRHTFSLSGGEMRRVALAGVLAMRPELLVLDEATAGLDPRGRRQVHSLLRRLQREEGITVLLVSNEMDEVAELADSVTVLHQGRTVLAGPVREGLGQAERLQEVGLTIPEATAIARDLCAAGLRMPADLLTASEVEEALWQALTH